MIGFFFSIDGTFSIFFLLLCKYDYIYYNYIVMLEDYEKKNLWFWVRPGGPPFNMSMLFAESFGHTVWFWTDQNTHFPRCFSASELSYTIFKRLFVQTSHAFMWSFASTSRIRYVFFSLQTFSFFVLLSCFVVVVATNKLAVKDCIRLMAGPGWARLSNRMRAGGVECVCVCLCPRTHVPSAILG